MQTKINRVLVLMFVLIASGAVNAQQSGGSFPGHDENNSASPQLNILRNPNPRADNSTNADLYRTFDGSDNNVASSELNKSATPLLRWTPSDYGDLKESMAGSSRPGPREISNAVSTQTESIINPNRASDFLWQWGQFFDHDIDLTDGVVPAEFADIAIPSNDLHFDPQGAPIRFNRSIYDPDTGTDVVNPREQLNEVTGWIDASNVYGSDIDRAQALRTNDGTGKLKTSAGNLLPFNELGLSNAGGNGSEFFVAGDVRANEQIGLTSMHTLFVREHNRLAINISARQPELDGDGIYQAARRIVGAVVQKITYDEFVPVLLGRNALKPYKGYDASVDARISNEFSTAAFRFGHSALSTHLLRNDPQGNEVDAGHLALRDTFFSPSILVNEGGIEPILRGLAAQLCQSTDLFIIDDVRNFLFGTPGAGGFDLAALNIQRGRDHGLPDYNSLRAWLGLDVRESFAEISSSEEIWGRLANIYEGDVSQVDAWVGGLAEDPVSGSHLGELFHHIIVNQLERLRDGDRFWYEYTLSGRELALVEATRLSDVIRRNTAIGRELSNNVFVVAGPRQPPMHVHHQ